jgi:two-component system response regulator FlrC
MSSFSSAQHALWLDPVEPLGAPAHARLGLLGLTIQRITVLEEIQHHLANAGWIVLRLKNDIESLLTVLSMQQATQLQIPIICRVDSQNIALAVSAMRAGACHVIAADDWSTSSWQVALTKNDSDKASASVAQTQSQATPKSFVFVDPVSQHLFALAQRVAQANVTALLEGPTGAGKEVLARVLHESSNRSKAPFVGLNCAALPEHLIDDMLFGHEKGAFTGATKDYKGLFEQARGGTLFLDEIGEMPMHLQAKLLLVLQERQLNRLGSERPVAVDVRIVAATNKDLRKAIADREFREDLYFRISTFKLRVPALKDRPGDILPLVSQLLVRHSKETQFTIGTSAQMQLLNYTWPGNVRELENVVQRAVVLCTDGCIEAKHLMFDDSPLTPEALELDSESLTTSNLDFGAEKSTATFFNPLIDASDDRSDTFENDSLSLLMNANRHASNLQEAVKTSEHQMILAAINSTESRMEAAAKLGISPRTLRYKLAKLKAENGSMALAA